MTTASSSRPDPVLSVVIPAYNEESRLPATLAELDSFFRERPELQPVEIVVVDDGSSDRTAEVARGVDSALEIVVVAHAANRGKGAAVRSGFLRSRGAMILLSDADLSTPIGELENLRPQLAADRVVIGSRAVDRSLITMPQPLYRDLMGRIFNLMERLLVVGGVADTQCGFKLFPGPLGRELAAAQRLDGFAFDVELVLLARHWGCEVREIGVSWHHVEASRVQPVRHSLQMFRDLLRMAWWRLGGGLPGRTDTRPR